MVSIFKKSEKSPAHGKLVLIIVFSLHRFGFVEFINEEAAQEALEKMNGKRIDGRPIYVDFANDPKESGGSNKTSCYEDDGRRKRPRDDRRRDRRDSFRDRDRDRDRRGYGGGRDNYGGGGYGGGGRSMHCITHFQLIFSHPPKRRRVT